MAAVKNGKPNDRPALHAALRRYRLLGATRVIAKVFVAAHKPGAIAHLVGSAVKTVQNIQKHHVDPKQGAHPIISALEKAQGTG